MLHCSRVTLSLFSKTKNNASFLPLLHSLLLILDYHQYCLFIIVIHFMLYYLFYWSFLILRNFDLLDYLPLEERTVLHVIFVLLKNNCDIRSSHSPGFQPCRMEVDFFSCKFFAFAEDKRTRSSLWDVAFIPPAGCVYHPLMACLLVQHLQLLMFHVFLLCR